MIFLSLRVSFPPSMAGNISTFIFSILSITSDAFLMAFGAPIPSVVPAGGSRAGDSALKLERYLLWNLISWVGAGRDEARRGRAMPIVDLV